MTGVGRPFVCPAYNEGRSDRKHGKRSLPAAFEELVSNIERVQ